MASTIEADIKMIKNLYMRLAKNGAETTANETLETLLGYRPSSAPKPIETVEAFISGQNAYKAGQAASEVDLITPHLRKDWLKGWQLAASRTADHAHTLETLIEDYAFYAELCETSSHLLRDRILDDQHKSEIEENAKKLNQLSIELWKIGKPNYSKISFKETNWPQKHKTIN